MSNQGILSGNDYGPIESSYGTAPIPQQQPLLQEVHDPNKKNFPPCWPLVRHTIAADIHPTLQTFMKKAYFCWLLHCLGLIVNMICIAAATFTKVTHLGNFFIGLTSLIIGIPGSFCIYFVLYSAVKKSNSFYFLVWFCLEAITVLFETFWAIGIVFFLTGGAGFMMMIAAFNQNQVAVGIMLAICTFTWIAIVIINITLFNSARIVYKDLGGNKAATRDFTNAAATTAYNNRDAIKQVVVDNKDTIRQVVVDNKDTIVDFARENKGTALKLAHDNRDTIWENREAVSGVFGSSPSTGAQSHV